MSASIPSAFADSDDQRHQPYNFHLIGIGLSAGGLEPLKAIVSQMPASIRAAVIVVHNDPIEASGLTQNLQEITQLPVIKVTKKERIRAGHIFVPAAGCRFQLRDRVLSVENIGPGRKSGRLIDACFRAIAYEAREKSICVILSGSGYDGLEGAIVVERHGGMVIAQDPATARFPMMPVTVIANDDPTFVLEPDHIGRLIAGRLDK
ncbi:MAG TPA: chemotaxis protein CheB [Puia sp.]|nr:chemotaxis protein CheB [Puia sp.]